MRDTAEAFLKDAQHWPGTPEAGIAHRLFGTTCWFGGNYDSARLHIEQALAAQDHERNRHLAPRFGYDISVITMFNLALLLWPLGEIDRTAQLVERAKTLAARSEHNPTVLLGHIYPSFLGGICRTPAEVAPHAKALLEGARQHGLPLWFAFSTFYVGWTGCWEGDPEGEAGMREGIAQLRQMDVHFYEPFFATLLAETQDRAGRPDVGLTILDAQLSTLERTGEHWFEAEVQRARGELLFRRDPCEAEAAFMRAIDIARSQQTRTFELRATTSLARLWRDQGKRTEARDLLAPIYGWFTEGFDTPVLQDSKALLDQLA
jgi:tetratricopeptide (TPR) repeat protein